MIEISDVYKSFAEGAEQHEVLTGVDLQAEPGDAIALFGRSGSGKSTLLNGLKQRDVKEPAVLPVRDVVRGKADSSDYDLIYVLQDPTEDPSFDEEQDLLATSREFHELEQAKP